MKGEGVNAGLPTADADARLAEFSCLAVRAFDGTDGPPTPRGVGAALVRAAEAYGRSRGCSVMQMGILCPAADEPPYKQWLQRWYLRLGYEHRETLALRFEPDEVHEMYDCLRQKVPCKTASTSSLTSACDAAQHARARARRARCRFRPAARARVRTALMPKQSSFPVNPGSTPRTLYHPINYSCRIEEPTWLYPDHRGSAFLGHRRSQAPATSTAPAHFWHPRAGAAVERCRSRRAPRI